MKFEVKSQWNGAVLFSIETDSWKLAVEAAIKSGADLSGANLRGADLYGANLRGADLYGANLRGANLYGANLRGANLRGADLRGANLYGADLYGADLRGADLYGANLYGADLYGADLYGAYLPSPQMVLSAQWNVVSNKLTADLMQYDAISHPDKKAFDKWAKGGPCPYDGVKVQRAANFQQDPTLWKKGKIDTPYNLMVRVLREKCKTDL